MTIAKKVNDYLQGHDIVPEVVRHERTGSASETAEAAHISGHRIAKGIVLRSDDRTVVVVTPASQHVALSKVRDAVDAKLDFASEDELTPLFPDCDAGAVPAIGMAYELETLVDRSLFEEPEVFFEGGDHESLVQLDADQFKSLFEAAKVGEFTSGPH